ncbi:MAG TPA: serine/threonine-protein kinase, partial [Myxococcaceae bacterium]
MQPRYEAELFVAFAEGLLTREEAERFREERREDGPGPLEWLREQGRLSEETLVALRRQVDERPGEQRVVAQEDGTATLTGPPKPDSPQVPDFPLPGWDRYQVSRFLGQGAMGQVYLAHDPRLNRKVALKLLRHEDPDRVRRLISEARAQARVSHERVCKVYEVGEAGGKVFIAMQYVDGQPLDRVASGLSVEQKAILIRDAAEGVHEAHRAGLIHRDLKPSNLMVETTGDGGQRLYVMDFGLARDWDGNATLEGSVVGTPHYMSPEQARGEVSRLDRRTDVYALGATLYALLAGQPPIPGENALEIVGRIATEEPRRLRELDPDIPADLEAITLKCLEKDRSARYDSARALAEDLDRFLSGEPVRARPTGLGYRLRKKARKHWLAMSLATLALLLVAGALGWAGFTRQEAARHEFLVRRFTEKVERIEALARYSGLSRLHDVRADHAEIRRHMAELEAEIQQAGAVA